MAYQLLKYALGGEYKEPRFLGIVRRLKNLMTLSSLAVAVMAWLQLII